MIFNTTKFRKNFNWHDFFAWFPVKLNELETRNKNIWVWLQVVERRYRHAEHRGHCTYHYNCYQYRLKGAENDR